MKSFSTFIVGRLVVVFTLNTIGSLYFGVKNPLRTFIVHAFHNKRNTQPLTVMLPTISASNHFLQHDFPDILYGPRRQHRRGLFQLFQFPTFLFYPFELKTFQI